MEYRQLGKTGLEVSAIGLGTEYLLDQPREIMDSVLNAAVKTGVNYIDLLYNGPRFWNDFGPMIRKYRAKVILAAHWGSGEVQGQHSNVRDQETCRRFFDRTLALVGNDYAELGLLMMVDDEALWDTWGQASLEHLARYQTQGRIGAIGMSSHKSTVALKAVRSGQLDVLMYPVNLASHTIAGNDELYQACADKGVGLVAMKPYAGGAFFLAEGSVFVNWVRAGGQGLQVEKAGPIRPTQCLAYVLSQPVSTVVPGVKSVDELQAALHFWEATEEEKDYSTVIASIHHYPPGQCVYCNHCLPCPSSIDIGQLIRLVDAAREEVTDELRAEYATLEIKASDCIECEECMERCPYEVDVIAKMQQAVELFEANAIEPLPL
jgi:predicted aldo/keto reductase-like oxidoreductase